MAALTDELDELFEQAPSSAVEKFADGALALELTFGDFEYFFAAQLVTFGAISYAQEITLPGNSLVDTFDVDVTAARADVVKATEVAQVRAGPSAVVAIGDKGHTLIVDFGTPRTVSTVTVESPYQIYSIATWNGAQFSSPIYQAQSIYSEVFPPHELMVTASGPLSTAQSVILPSEVRTERLEVEIAGSGAANLLIENLKLVLPDAPGDLELRIDGGAPAWTHAGVVQAGPQTTIVDDAWNNQSKRVVHVADALNEFVGDPTASDDRVLELKLTSRAPGQLKLEESARSIRRIRRAEFDGKADTVVAFDEEGEADIVLMAPGLPADADVLEVRLTAEADFGDTRTIPPVGPDAFPTVDLTLDPERAVLIRLGAGSGLAELTAIRAALAAGQEGAEAQVVLWDHGDAGPGSPLPEATSDPVTLAAATSPVWTMFSFKKPVEIDAAEPPWAAILVTRGNATLALATSSGAADPVDSQVFRLGPHGGPWSLPPAGLRDGAFASLRGRARMTGLAPKDAPLAPIALEIPGSGTGLASLDPGARGQSVSIKGGTGGEQRLQLVAFGPGRVTLRDVDIITSG